MCLNSRDLQTFRQKTDIEYSVTGLILYSYYMRVCSVVKTITGRCRGRPDALLHEAECNSASGCPRYRGVIV